MRQAVIVFFALILFSCQEPPKKNTDPGNMKKFGYIANGLVANSNVHFTSAAQLSDAVFARQIRDSGKQLIVGVDLFFWNPPSDNPCHGDGHCGGGALSLLPDYEQRWANLVAILQPFEGQI